MHLPKPTAKHTQKTNKSRKPIFQKALEKHGFTIKKFKTDGNCYEMYGKSKGGKKVEMYFDTKDGKIVKAEID